MLTPLDDNQEHLGKICEHFSLGEPQQALESVAGGFHHRMWQLQTDLDTFAIKQLADDIDLEDANAMRQFELTESVAEACSSHDVPAVFARKVDDQYLLKLQDQAYLVYPWVTASALAREDITPGHVDQVAAIFARIHRADLQVPGLVAEQKELHEQEKIEALVEFARSRNSSRSSELQEYLPLFKNLVARHNVAVDALSNHTVVSHGDLDHKNILWISSDEPLLIDWESARPLNPTHEVILEALDWSGITMDFNESLFDGFIRSYLRAGGDGRFNEVEAAFDCVLGDWVNWLMYNVGRSIELSDAAQRQLGQEQVDLALATILRLEKLVPRLLRKLRN